GEACAAGAPPASYLLTRTLPGAYPLNEFLESTLRGLEPPRRALLRPRLATALGEFLARLHDAGVTHHDLHPGNLLLSLDGDVPSLALIALAAVRLGEPLSWRARGANLIVLNRWFMLRAERADRLRCFQAYLRACSPTVPVGELTSSLFCADP